ncbi:LanC-like protein 2 [Takifugu flavidus]|uniref:LanC-like protein 2 n=1 Tax=Takifugu flavidus TaxID=433684 RepID=A0A5C6NXS9_9TELE|nr:LanC-like protein 2 [Takifugu flavidus]
MRTPPWGRPDGDAPMRMPPWGRPDEDASMGTPRWGRPDGDAPMGTPVLWAQCEFISCHSCLCDLLVLQFADWCLAYGTHGCRIPDRPYSLFEGMAGTILYLSELADPQNSCFPAFEL